MKKLILSICMVVFLAGITTSELTAKTTKSSYSKAQSTSKKKTSDASATKSASSSSNSIPSWLPGRYVYPRLDRTFAEYVYEIYEIGSDGYMRFGESRSKYATPANPKFKYYVQGNIIYDGDTNKPFLIMNSSNNSLTHYSNSNRVFVKVK